MTTSPLGPLPTTFATTREALRALACYVVAPARKARTGRIGLEPFGEGFATPTFDDGSRLAVEGGELRWVPGDAIPITTVQAAAEWAGVTLSADPGVGHDLPPFTPEARLAVDGAASRALGAWYAFGERVLDGLPAGEGRVVSAAQLWPEHFDLAVVVERTGAGGVNVGCSPGDDGHRDPYVYVGPHDLSGLDGDFWNAPFGALLPYATLAAAPDPVATAIDFVATGLDLLAEAASEPPADPPR